MKIILKKSLTLALMDIGMMDQLFNELQQEPFFHFQIVLASDPN